MPHLGPRSPRRPILGLLARGIPVGLCAAVLAGCSTATVRRYSPTEGYLRVPGVPFYVQRAACGQETAWQQRALRVRLVIQPLGTDGKPLADRARSFEKLVPRTPVGEAEVDQLKELVDRARDTTVVIAKFRALPVADLQSTEGRFLLSNQTKPFLYVDYGNQYYLNADRPLVGNASVAAEISPEGTLAKVDAKVEDSTLTAFASLVPINAFLTRELVRPAPESPAGGNKLVQTRPTVRYTLAIESVEAVHRLSRVFTRKEGGTEPGDTVLTFPCQQQAAIQPNATHTGYAYTFSASQQGESKPPANTVSVSGQIVLPEKKP